MMDAAGNPLVPANQIQPPQQVAQPGIGQNQINILYADFNGLTFGGTNEGEEQISNESVTCWVPRNRPPNWNEETNLVVLSDPDAALIVEYILNCIWGNYHKLRSLQNPLSHEICYKISYMRSIHIMYGFADPDVDCRTHNCRYNNARYLGANDLIDIDLVWYNGPVVVNMNKWQRQYRPAYRSSVAIVAYVFRARGHHYVDGGSYETVYSRVWKACQYNTLGADTGIPWINLAREAHHVIFPDTLDKCWFDWSNSDTVAGALKKRVDTYAAGTAAIAAVNAGIEDLKMCAPPLITRLQTDIAYLEELKAQLRAHRWAGSVNANFYSAPRMRIDEIRLAAAAATIKALLEKYVENSQLAKSKALQRVAGNAPLTGALLVKALEGVINASPQALMANNFE